MCNVSVKLASHAGVFRRARISSLPTREEIRAPLKTPAWDTVKSKLQHPPPGAYCGHLQQQQQQQVYSVLPFCTGATEEFDYQSLPGGGEFDPHGLWVGNLNCTLDFMRNLSRGELSWGTWYWRIFIEQIVRLWPIGYRVCAVFEGI